MRSQALHKELPKSPPVTDIIHYVVQDPATIPATVKLHGVSLKIHPDGTVEISGFKKLKIADADAEVEIAGKNVSINAKETLTLNGEHHMVAKSDRIDLNPDEYDFDYIRHVNRNQ